MFKSFDRVNPLEDTKQFDITIGLSELKVGDESSLVVNNNNWTHESNQDINMDPQINFQG